MLAIAGAIAVVWLVDANRFRPEIERRFAAATGLTLRLAGDIDLKFFPWLALRTDAAEIANPPHFSDPLLARWAEGRVGVRVLPLLRGELVIDRIRFVGLEVNLEKNARGSANWEFASAEEPGATALPDIEGVELRDGRLRYRDRSRGPDEDLDITLAGIDVTVESIREGAPIVVGDAGFDAEFRGMRFTVGTSRASFDPASSRIEARELTIESGSATLRAAVAGRLMPAPALSGDFLLEAADLRETLTAAGITVPPTEDPAVLGELEARASVRLGPEGLVVDPLTLALDDTRLTGTLRRGPAPGAIFEFDLRGDRIELARYLEPDEAISEPFQFPTKLLGALPVRGVLVLDEATFGEVVAKDVTLRAVTDDDPGGDLQSNAGARRGEPR